MHTRRTHLVFLWHMHQPCYRKVNSKDYYLPWTRLHAVKDYYPFALLLSRFHAIKGNFNFSGILLEQIRDYTVNKASDYYLKLSQKDPASLTSLERKFILERFFGVNRKTMIEPYPRYLELYQKFLSKQFTKFSRQDIFDLQVYFNLVWFHSLTIEEDKNLQHIFAKGKNFSLSEKKYVFQKHYDVMEKIFPLYQKLCAEGRIEISITPYYHPIMPLLCDTDITKQFSYLTAPSLRFAFPEDALWHVENAKNLAEKVFHTSPCGSWPSEGSVSEAVVSIYQGKNFRWLATDEDILFKSLAGSKIPVDLLKRQRHIIYQPYSFDSMNFVFRDKNLSDTIGFSYHSWQNLSAAAFDIVGHFRRIHEYVGKIYPQPGVVIAMDGENAWEYYPDNGRQFLSTLYAEIEKHPELLSNTISGYTAQQKPKRLERLSPGSWINGDFGVWVGSEKNNTNWEILARLRRKLSEVKLDERKRKKIEDYLHIIEGSDWNWWNTFEDSKKDFAQIFFSYVKEISKLLGVRLPSLPHG